MELELTYIRNEKQARLKAFQVVSFSSYLSMEDFSIIMTSVRVHFLTAASKALAISSSIVIGYLESSEALIS